VQGNYFGFKFLGLLGENFDVASGGEAPDFKLSGVAVGAGDIGHYFPDTDPQWKGISSLLLLEKVGKVVKEQGYKVGNTDATIVAQNPKLEPYLDKMKQNIAKALAIGPAQVNVKATTTEKLGFPGREEGIAADAVALVEKT